MGGPQIPGAKTAVLQRTEKITSSWYHKFRRVARKEDNFLISPRAKGGEIYRKPDQKRKGPLNNTPELKN